MGQTPYWGGVSWLGYGAHPTLGRCPLVGLWDRPPCWPIVLWGNAVGPELARGTGPCSALQPGRRPQSHAGASPHPCCVSAGRRRCPRRQRALPPTPCPSCPRPPRPGCLRAVAVPIQGLSGLRGTLGAEHRSAPRGAHVPAWARVPATLPSSLRACATPCARSLPCTSRPRAAPWPRAVCPGPEDELPVGFTPPGCCGVGVSPARRAGCCAGSGALRGQIPARCGGARCGMRHPDPDGSLRCGQEGASSIAPYVPLNPPCPRAGTRTSHPGLCCDAGNGWGEAGEASITGTRGVGAH